MGALRKIVWGLVLAGLCFAGGPALAEKRVALVIGNSAYQKVAKLPNPANDAAPGRHAQGGGLRSGRDQVQRRSPMRCARHCATSPPRPATPTSPSSTTPATASNSTAPTTSSQSTPRLRRTATCWTRPFRSTACLFAVEPAKQLRLVILDACRDNPFAKTMKRTLASRAVGRGLAKVEPTSPNTMIAFAAKAGSTASDGDGKNSPFAAALIEHLPKPGLDLRRAFGFVRDDVLKNTGNKQEPYVYGSLGGNDVPLVPAKPVATGPQADPQTAVRRDYELALQLGNRDAWEAFVSQYPDRLLCQPRQRPAEEDRGRRDPGLGRREGAAGGAGEGATRGRRRTASRAGQGRRRRQGRRGGSHRSREGEADRAGEGGCRREGATSRAGEGSARRREGQAGRAGEGRRSGAGAHRCGEGCRREEAAARCRITHRQARTTSPSICRAPCRPSCAASAAAPAPSMATGTRRRRRRSISSTSMRA